MPVIYEIDRTKKLIRTRCTGPVTFNEVVKHFQELPQDPECPEQLDVLLDLSDLTSMPQSIELMAVGQEIGKIRWRVRFNACAIIAPSDALYGMIRMFEVFVEEHFAGTRVFRTVPEAEDWLILQQKSTGRNL